MPINARSKSLLWFVMILVGVSILAAFLAAWNGSTLRAEYSVARFDVGIPGISKGYEAVSEIAEYFRFGLRFVTLSLTRQRLKLP